MISGGIYEELSQAAPLYSEMMKEMMDDLMPKLQDCISVPKFRYVTYLNLPIIYEIILMSLS